MPQRRAIIVSRIFSPEPAAAAFRLNALSDALVAQDFQVDVITTRFGATRSERGLKKRISRWPVLRNRDGYVRGYLSYLSFDIPVFFRLLVSKRPDVVIVEPPPTTGIVVRIVCGLRRIPYIAYAPDLISDAMDSMDSSSLVKRFVRWIERLTYQGAAHTISVSDGISAKLSGWISSSSITNVGNGIDTQVFSVEGPQYVHDAPFFLYAGTASEFQGATVFLDAFELVAAKRERIDLIFVGQGSDFEEISRRAVARNDARVRILARVAPEEAAGLFRGALASLVSIRPGLSYDFAIPTKIFASCATGVPVIFSGSGAAKELVERNGLGWVSDFSPESVAEAMIAALDADRERPSSQTLAGWVDEYASLKAAAVKAVAAIQSTVGDLS
jgi:glycosyltransferase involved in cell wall biosynthesis